MKYELVFVGGGSVAPTLLSPVETFDKGRDVFTFDGEVTGAELTKPDWPKIGDVICVWDPNFGSHQNVRVTSELVKK